MSGLEAVALTFFVGACFGAVVAWAWFERCGRPQEVKIVIDRELASKIDSGFVMAWLDSRGLVWMPKGIDFKAKVRK